MSLRRCTVVVPTVGRPSLGDLLDRLAAADGPRPAELVVVDDRAGADNDELDVARTGLPPTRVESSGGRGPAAARNVGWRTSRTPWIAFLDDDVVPDSAWYHALAADVAGLAADVAATQGQVRVPLPSARSATDWERSTAGLESAAWITADMAYRRSALAAVGGFDERFRRAYREDADLALRLLNHSLRLVQGTRSVTHPVRPADRWTSVRMQAGNGDDVLMRRLHGPEWRRRAHAPRGRRRRHAAITVSGVAAVALAAVGRRRAAALAATGWAVGTAELAAARIAPGPKDRRELSTMLLTSVAIPVAATWHTARGLVRYRGAGPWRGVPDAVLLDRDGTLVVDVPYNGDPGRVVPIAGVREACDRLRAAGVRLGVITNQSGIARGLVTREQVDAVNARVDELLGPFGTWQVCPHGPTDGCSCRKPAPGMVKEACTALDVDPATVVVIGDIGADVEAALSAGARAILVPTRATRAEEVTAAPACALTIGEAVDLVLRGA